jgi:surface carbohydrate biosynthesis protein
MALICLPCEIQHRELDAKLLLATRLCSTYGHHCLIGYDKYFNEVISDLGPVVLLDKSMSSIMMDARIKKVKQNGGFVAISDEEGINDLAETPFAFISRLDEQSWSLVDVYCCWGKYDLNFFSNFCKAPANKLVNIGNCRSDLLNNMGQKFYCNEISSIKNLFGDYLLISDNFSIDYYHKNYVPPKFKNTSDSLRRAQIKEWNFQQKLASARRDKLSRLIDEILAKTNKNIVIRPHPVNDPIFWHKKYRLQNCVSIIYKHNADPWIHASDGVLSCGCTVGLQAVYAGKKSFHFEESVDHPSRSITKELSFGISNLSDYEAGIRERHHQSNVSSYYWNTSGSSTERFAELLSRGAEKLPRAFHKVKLKYIKELVPIAPKWGLINTKNIAFKVQKWSEIINERQPSISKVSPGVYLISPPQ